jgi:hypothetical protein
MDLKKEVLQAAIAALAVTAGTIALTGGDVFGPKKALATDPLPCGDCAINCMCECIIYGIPACVHCW